MAVGIDLGHVEFSGSEAEEDFESFCGFLGGPPQDHRDGSGIASMYSPLFNKAPYNGQRLYPLKVRQKPISFDDPDNKLGQPLFAGNLAPSRFRIGNAGNLRCELQSKSSRPFFLNPSRALNHRRAELVAGSCWTDCMFARRDGVIMRGLDGKDNLLPDDLSQHDYLAGEWHYLTAVTRALRDDVERAWRNATNPLDGSGCRASACPDLRLMVLILYSLETYWEFSTEDATALLERLTPILKAYAKKHCDRTHAIDEESESNSKSLKLRVNKGLSIRLYAKCCDRLRIEVIHSAKELLPRYSTQSVSGLRGMIGTLREKAATAVNHLLGFLSDWANETPQERANSTAFLSRWFQVMGHGSDSLGLLGLLRVNGRISGGVALSSLEAKALKKARTAGLLVCRNGFFLPGGSDQGESETDESGNGGHLTCNGSARSCVAYTSDTQTANSDFVTYSNSTTGVSKVQVLPSPPSAQQQGAAESNPNTKPCPYPTNPRRMPWSA